MNNTRNQTVITAFGKHIRVLRKERKLSMEKLAELAGIDYRLLSYIEHGEVNPTLSTMHQLAIGLNVKLDVLFQFSVKKDKK